MKHAVPLFLEDDTVYHLDWLTEQLSRQRNISSSRSEAIEWLVRQHWKKMQVQKRNKGPAAKTG